MVRAMLWLYVKTNLVTSFQLWDRGQRMATLIGAVAALALTLLLLFGIEVTFAPEWQPMHLVALGGIWFLFLVLIVTPYRMWRSEKDRADALESRASVPPDWDEIDRRRQFRLYEVASYWVGEQPKLPLSPRAREQFDRLSDAIKRRDLSVIRDDLRETIYDAYDEAVHGRETKANPNWRLEREDILAYLTHSGEKTPFLHPKERV